MTREMGHRPAAVVAAAPHAHAGTSIGRTMGLVILALLPATALGLGQFGWPAILLFALTVSATLITEAACLQLAGKPLRVHLLDGSALVTGWLLALSLPPWAPWWIGVLGAVIAIVLGKQVFGGTGQNLFNPAMVARVALLIAFPLEMTSYTAPDPLWSAGALDLHEGLAVTFAGQVPDGFSGATALGHVRTELGRGLELDAALAGAYSPSAGALGTIGGSMGETSALLLLAGGLLLIYLRVITWHIPAAMLGTLAVLATLMHRHRPGPLSGRPLPPGLGRHPARRLLHRHGPGHLARVPCRSADLRGRMRAPGVRHPHLGRLPRGGRLRRAPHERLYPGDRPLRAPAGLRARPQG